MRSLRLFTVALLLCTQALAQESTKQLSALDFLIGHWDVWAEHRLSAQGPWEEGPARATIRKALNGTLLEEDYSGTRQGRPYFEKALFGINNATNQFQKTFADSEHGIQLTFEGDQNLPVKSESFYLFRDSGWEILRERSFEYNESNQLVMMVEKKRDEDSLVLSSKTVYNFSDDKLREELNYEHRDAQWVCTGKSVFKMKKGVDRSVEIFTYNQETGNWQLDTKGKFVSDKEDRLLSKTYKNLSNGKWNFIDKQSYNYDKKGRLIEQTWQTWDGEWKNNQYVKYLYDDANRNFQQNIYKWKDGNWVAHSRRTDSFDAHGNITVKLFEKAANDSWKPDLKRILTY